jgi:hypothetical protein
MLNQLVYCPRLFYYEHVKGVFIHNTDTRCGAARLAAPQTSNAKAQTQTPRLSNRRRISAPQAAPIPAIRNPIARLTANGKIRHQRKVIMRNHGSPPLTATERLKYVALAALEAQNTEELLGIEGSAALVCFENFRR